MNEKESNMLTKSDIGDIKTHLLQVQGYYRKSLNALEQLMFKMSNPITILNDNLKYSSVVENIKVLRELDQNVEQLLAKIEKNGVIEMSCKYAEKENYGWKCNLTEKSCKFLVPNSELCADMTLEPLKLSEEQNIVLTKLDWKNIEMYLSFMKENYKKSSEFWEELAKRKDLDGEYKYPVAVKNNKLLKETDRSVERLLAKIGGVKDDE